MYYYADMKKEVFLPENQEKFLQVRDKAHELLKIAGVFDMDHVCSCSWLEMAMVDRLVELGEIREIGQTKRPPGQYRLFVSTKR